ncbi:signal peptide peptidase SppA [Bradymonas sediminis]|uniref:Signal peptide peptidase SppA n=1 Tax=Bradymonas sediminis TaxID=1548548 RepID=A0A2Z4FNL3_9DELT|nr:signal peptide peptidase SppA [Bradymonas sediminis]AWV90316.1 signal peptide peptidase SppA [Bradymonas sediminis]TDP75708.1 signal peptide peptidase A [Bradymonas sediminis]
MRNILEMRTRLVKPAARRAAPLWVALAALLAFPTSALAQEEPTPSDGIIFPDQSITTRADATSLEVNPAGLGFMRGMQFALGLQEPSEDFKGVSNEGVGAFLAGGTGAFAAGFSTQWMSRSDLGYRARDFRKYTFGAGVSTGSNLSLGAALNFFGSSDDAALDELMSWDLGLMWRPSANLGFGVRVRDLNQPYFYTPDPSVRQPGSALPIRADLGVALRFWDGRALLDPAVGFSSTGTSLFFRPRVALEPFPGVRIFARTEFDFDLEPDNTSTTWNQTVAGLSLHTYGVGAETAAIADFSGESKFLGSTHLISVGSQRARELAPPERRWQLVNLNGGIAEQPSSGFLRPTIDSFLSLLLKIEQLTNDPSIEGVVFNVGESGLGYAQIWELRQAIARLRAAGKSTVSVLTNPTFRETYLASAAENLWLLPPAPYGADGVSMSMTSYAALLAKAGIEAEFLRIGRYKSAPESYTFRTPSPEATEQITDYLDGLYAQATDAMAGDRSMSAQAYREAVDAVPHLPSDAVEMGLADNVIYLDSIQERLREEFGGHLRLEDRYPTHPAADMRWGSRPEVAVVVISGMIVRGQSGGTPFLNETVSGSDTLTKVFGKLRRDPNIRAVVLRIDSPGGSAVASDLIFREIRQLAKDKPVIASMGNVAASGGYYAAAGGDEIFATPHTLTGSIGIFAGKFSISKLAGMLGVSSTRLQRGARSDSFSLFHPWDAAQREGVSKSITYLYRLFIEQVASTRPLSVDEVDAVGRGHIWDGERAKQHKLVDRIGGLTDAMHRAAELAGLPADAVDYRLYPDDVGIFDPGATAVHAAMLEKLGADVLGMDSSADQLSLDSAVGGLIQHLGRGILMPLLYHDQEALTLLPVVVEVD